MKRCPTCQKTFDDNMRFCQTDGTPLVEDATPQDPYKTMVASKEDLQSALNAASLPEPSGSKGIGAPEDEPLELPSDPPRSTAASEFETKIAGRDVIEIPPIAESEDVPPPPPPSFGEPSTPSSPFEAQSGPNEFPTTPPIPSPFGVSSPPPAKREPEVIQVEPEEPTYFEPEVAAEPEPAPSYNEPSAPASPFADPAPPSNPFEAQSPPPSPMAQSQWTSPSPAQQSGGSGGPFIPPASGKAGTSSMLGIISLILGAVGIVLVLPTIILTICGVGPFFLGIASVIVGILAKSRIKSSPAQYSGGGLATVGIVLGVLDIIAPIIIGIAWFLFWGGLSTISNITNG